MSTMTINGKLAPLPDDPDALLVDVVRDTLGLTGTKLVCGAGVCGACTVLVDGAPVVSCLLPACAAAGKQVTTVEGIGAAKLHPVQKAFMAHDALQCGFCTPGFVVEAAAFHDGWRAYLRAAIFQAYHRASRAGRRHGISANGSPYSLDETSSKRRLPYSKYGRHNRHRE